MSVILNVMGGKSPRGHIFKKMKKITLLNFMFLCVLLIFIGVFFGGGFNFVTTSPKDLLLYSSLGLLTFVSVFFSFIYSKPLDWLLKFHENLNKEEATIRKELPDNFDSKALDKIVTKLEKIETLRKKVNPEFWLYFAVLCFLSVTVIVMLNPMSPTWLITIKNLVLGITFHLGLFATFSLVISLLALTISKK